MKDMTKESIVRLFLVHWYNKKSSLRGMEPVKSKSNTESNAEEINIPAIYLSVSSNIW